MAGGVKFEKARDAVFYSEEYKEYSARHRVRDDKIETSFWAIFAAIDARDEVLLGWMERMHAAQVALEQRVAALDATIENHTDSADIDAGGLKRLIEGLDAYIRGSGMNQQAQPSRLAPDPFGPQP